MVDKLADREFTSLDNSTSVTDQLTLVAISQKSHKLKRQLLKHRWDSVRLKRCVDFELEMCRKEPPEPTLPSAVYARLIAA